MIHINLSYFDTIMGPKTFCIIPHSSDKDIEEYTNNLLNISEFIDLKFFVYVSSTHFKTANIYTQIPSEWARGNLEMLLISIILIDEDFNRLYVFEDLLERMAEELNNLEDAYLAFYSEYPNRAENERVHSKKREIIKILEGFLSEITELVKTAKKLPTTRDVIETGENLQDEFVILDREETTLEAARKLAASPRILLGCVIEDGTPVGVVDEDDILNRVVLKGEDPLAKKVGAIMTTDVIMVDSNEPLQKVIELMINTGIPAIPILHNQKFHGVFSIFDAASHNQQILELIGDKITEIAQRKYQDFKNLKVKMWKYIRNIDQNKRIHELRMKF